MFSHIHIGVSDFDRALTFYRSLMEDLGYPLKFVERERPWAGWMPLNADRPLFLIGTPFDGQVASPGNGQMVALLAGSRDIVDRTYEKAIALGARNEGRPGLRPEYHRDYYGAYFRDPDGNKICICCHSPG